ncbi:GT2 family glycosyltransferase [Paenibacillus cellulosilyticus]|uniref:GT2 family glycosyltransferase n=1 Tax=Paenibacillus cellulosilyticus TaxID=375489 RepID=A0A2V2YTF6_9BACL|nr:glycosyltransferase [Paenibacillus cellulosilyticus]PWW02768.1 GT2 family glycosyltransferase [Paenibacillus cellulosilyticus]QKS45691.1 glycosyltransferase [Paenibacillus cellulosilyticus]
MVKKRRMQGHKKNKPAASALPRTPKTKTRLKESAIPRVKKRKELVPEAISLPSMSLPTDTPRLESVHFDTNNRAMDLPHHEKAGKYPLDVFRFPIIDWHYRFQRPQQFCLKFANDGYRVFYFHVDTKAIDDTYATFEDICRNIEVIPVQERIWTVRLCSYNPLNAYRSTIQHELDIHYLLMSLEAIKQRFAITNLLSIVDLPFWSTLVFRLANNTIIYDCMDEHHGFNNVSADNLALEEPLLKQADLVIASSEQLLSKASEMTSNVLLLRNAADFEHFNKPPELLAPQLRENQKPVIGYHGAIAQWFDSELISFLASRHPDWEFVLIGHNYSLDQRQYDDHVHFVGELPYSELPSYLHGFDVCVIPFLLNPLTLATNPVKVYEYLAAGKPVIATRLPELEAMDGLVVIADTYLQFEEAIQMALEDQSNEKHALLRSQYASKHTWLSRYQQLMKHLTTAYFPKVSIVIAAYNNFIFTERCVESIFAHNRNPNLEVIIVDNGSSDETRNWGGSHSQLKLVRLSHNLGYAAANNLGCRLSVGDYILLLNNDTIVSEGWMEGLIEPLRNNLELGMVGPVSNSVGNDQMLEFAVSNDVHGAEPAFLNKFKQLYKGRRRMTDNLGFFCVAMKREVYEAVGGLDENFGIGMFEDDDYCLRVRNSGYQLAIIEDVFVHHSGSATLRQLPNTQYQSLFDQNKRLFESKWNMRWKPHPRPISALAEWDSFQEVSATLGKHRV